MATFTLTGPVQKPTEEPRANAQVKVWPVRDLPSTTGAVSGTESGAKTAMTDASGNFTLPLTQVNGAEWRVVVKSAAGDLLHDLRFVSPAAGATLTLRAIVAETYVPTIIDPSGFATLNAQKADRSELTPLAADAESASTKAVRASDRRLTGNYSPLLPNNTDLDTLIDPSTVLVLSTNTHANRPETGTNAILRTYYATSTSGYQEWYTINSTRAQWVRFRGSGGWGTWGRVDAGVAATVALASPLLTSGTDLDTIAADTSYLVQASGTYPNRPETANGILRTHYISSTSILQLFYVAGVSNNVWRRWRGSGGWTSWSRVDAQAAVDSAKTYTDATVAGSRVTGGSGTKTVPVALTVGGGAATYPQTSRGVRLPITLGAPVSRFRVHVRNINPRYGNVNTGAVVLTSIWLGPHNGSGGYSSAPTMVSGSGSTGADGSEWVSGWINTPLLAGRPYLLGFGFVAGAATQSVVGANWTTTDPADAGNTAAAVSAQTAAPLDVWLEAETPSTTPVIAAWGDSLSSGVGSTLPVHDSWLSQHCRNVGALPVHYTASGDNAASWAGTLTAYKWTRWAALAKPDAVVAAMGSNDVFNGDSLATIQGNWQTAVVNLAATVCPAVYAATILPRDGVTGTLEDTRRSLNTWLKTLPGGVRDVFDFVPAVSSDDENINAGLTGDGIHLTTAGYALVAGTVVRPVTTRAPFVPYPTTGRPSAARMGAGATYFDSTLNRPVWSDGTAWRDASGVTV